MSLPAPISSRRGRQAVDLDDPLLLVSDGLNPSESDPRFHQQMVYAIASRTIQMFETALGRDIHWRRADRFGDDENDDALRKKDDIRVLKLYPHAMHQANAYYSPQAHGILFGYFKANNTGQGRNLPGQRIFTCLSQDIIAHEVTHAVIDGIRTYFTEPTNPDVLAFHEGFADLCALFAHFSHKAALIETIRSTGGQLYQTYLTPVAPGAFLVAAMVLLLGKQPGHVGREVGTDLLTLMGMEGMGFSPPLTGSIYTFWVQQTDDFTEYALEFTVEPIPSPGAGAAGLLGAAGLVARRRRTGR